MKSRTGTSSTVFALSTLGCLISSAYAQAPKEAPLLEEVIVTAAKIEKSLQDIPVSVSALSGDKLDKAGIEDIEDLTAFVPNLHLTETGISTQLRMRGIGSGNSQGFEQSVGVFIDGIYHGRAQLFRAPIFDMERVEVMRGPQSTLFGKNTSSGAVELITAKPTDEFTGRITASYETEFATTEVNGFLSGPLTNNLGGRIAFRFLEDDGYMINTFKATEEPSQEDTSVRATLDWAPTDKLQIIYTGEVDTFDVVGRAIEITRDDLSPQFNADYRTLTSLISSPPFDAEQDYLRQTNADEFSDNEINSHRLTLHYDWDGIDVTAITGFVGFEYDENCDCDFFSGTIFDLKLDEEYDQISQEIRFSAAPTAELEWIAGLFFQSYEQTFSDHLKIPTDTLLIPVGILGGAPFPASFAGSGVARDFEANSDAWSLFGQVTWEIDDNIRLELGGRFTQESKDATRVIEIVDLERNLITDPITAGELATAYKTVFKLDSVQTPQALTLIPATGEIQLDANGNPIPFAPDHPGANLSGSRDESEFTPVVRLLFDFDSGALAYASYSTGYKSGGFDPRSNNNERFEFEEENVRAFELGYKTTFDGGNGEINLAYFRNTYLDLQVSQFDGAVGFNVGNAAKTLTQGLEIDGRWALSEHIVASYGLAYLNFEFLDFEDGNCNQIQIINGEGRDTDGDGASDLCSYTGKRGVYTPKYTANLTLDYSRDIGGYEFSTSLDLQWQDEQNVHTNLDPNGVLDAYTMAGLRIALEDENWGVAFLGKNLFDEDVISYSANAPLSGTTFGTNTFYSFLRRPQTFAFEATLRF